MDTTTIISFATAIGMISSMILNWVQYRRAKRGSDLSDFEKQLDVLKKLQDMKDEKFKIALETKDKEIEALKAELQAFKTILDKNTAKIIVLQTAVNKLIGGGCKRMQCQQRVPYPLDELGDVLGLLNENDD